jgi:hypothetical protein
LNEVVEEGESGMDGGTNEENSDSDFEDPAPTAKASHSSKKKRPTAEAGSSQMKSAQKKGLKEMKK